MADTHHPQGTPATHVWIENSPTLGVIIAFVLITLYVLPVYLIGGVEKWPHSSEQSRPV